MEWHGLLYLRTNKVECEGDFVESQIPLLIILDPKKLY